MTSEARGTGNHGTGVVLHAWSLVVNADELARLRSLLDEDECSRAEAFRPPDVRRHFVVARGRLRERLAERISADPQDLAFRYGPAGKPELIDDATIHFNLAHSHDLAVLAVAGEPVGVDVERRRPMKSRTALARRWFHPTECERIETAADPLAEFYRVWTGKEAALKLVGVGVGESLPRVVTPADAAGGWAGPLPTNPLGLTRCWVRPVSLDADHTATLATADASAPVTVSPATR